VCPFLCTACSSMLLPVLPPLLLPCCEASRSVPGFVWSRPTWHHPLVAVPSASSTSAFLRYSDLVVGISIGQLLSSVCGQFTWFVLIVLQPGISASTRVLIRLEGSLVQSSKHSMPIWNQPLCPCVCFPSHICGSASLSLHTPPSQHQLAPSPAIPPPSPSPPIITSPLLITSPPSPPNSWLHHQPCNTLLYLAAVRKGCTRCRAVC